jgi:hypothetical protein
LLSSLPFLLLSFSLSASFFVLYFFPFPNYVYAVLVAQFYRVFRVHANWTVTHTSHKDTEQSTIEPSITLDGLARLIH